MKKTIFALCLCTCVLISGCSGVSQEEYDSAVSLNSELESKREAWEDSYNAASKKFDDLKEKYDKLSDDAEKLKQDNKELKEENESLNSRISELENNSQDPVSENEETSYDKSEQKREYVLSLGYGSYVTEKGSTWYLDANNADSYITYPEDLGYNIDDAAAYNIFSDMADIMVNGLQNKSAIPMASFFVCENDGTLIATTLPMIVGEELEGFPLTFYGDYSYINDLEDTQLVQSAWSSDAD